MEWKFLLRATSSPSLPPSFFEAAEAIPRQTVEFLPACVLEGLTETWAMAIEGCLDGIEAWGRMAAVRPRLSW